MGFTNQLLSFIAIDLSPMAQLIVYTTRSTGRIEATEPRGRASTNQVRPCVLLLSERSFQLIGDAGSAAIRLDRRGVPRELPCRPKYDPAPRIDQENCSTVTCAPERGPDRSGRVPASGGWRCAGRWWIAMLHPGPKRLIDRLGQYCVGAGGIEDHPEYVGVGETASEILVERIRHLQNVDCAKPRG